ncbi:ATP-binding protein [Phenylobacterium aquaticum]|uniref:ATP-binding protein n=1 Tax=Phenylobacterium aquaticum TaxID=1763816 RepID=UPI0026EEA06C|nr:ATP-binding protein [Phenylobacterium aquaticum]
MVDTLDAVSPAPFPVGTGAPSDPSLFHRVLENHIKGLALTSAFDVAASLILAVIGHPWLALAMAPACLAADLGLRALYRGWLARADSMDAATGLTWHARCVLARGVVTLAAPTALMLMRPQPADLVFLGLIASGVLLVSVIQSVLAPQIFRQAVIPPMTALAALVFAVQARSADLALFGALVWLGLIAAMIGKMATRTKDDLLDRQDEKNRLIDHLTTARDAAEDAREDARRASLAKSTFLATMSHEIRTPMNGVLGMAQLLQRSDMTPAQRQQVETLIKSGELLMVILNDILDLSKIDAGQMEISKTSCDLRTLLAEMEIFWAPTAAERGLALSVEVAEAVPAYAALDPRRVRQVLFNLVGNALKFTREGGVSVTLTCEGDDALVFAVSDTGVGIDEFDMPHLFEMFSQVDATDVRRFAGAGLGLAICKELSGLMGGSVAVESVLDQGSTFRVRLPLEVTEAPALADLAAQAITEEEAPVLSILAADDNPTNLIVLEQLLGAMGFVVRKAAGGREALEALTSQAFDLVLMDIQMPEMTGIDVLQALRATPGPNRATPLIAVTADAMTLGAERYTELGFAGYVTKPVQVKNLVSAMMAAVANPDEEEQDGGVAASA